MNIYISSNFKKHFNTHIDFLDHNWINFFNEKNFFFRNIPNSIQVVNRLLKQKKKIDLIILPGGNDLFGHTRLTKTRFDVEKKTYKIFNKEKNPFIRNMQGYASNKLLFWWKNSKN